MFRPSSGKVNFILFGSDGSEKQDSVTVWRMQPGYRNSELAFAEAAKMVKKKKRRLFV